LIAQHSFHAQKKGQARRRTEIRLRAPIVFPEMGIYAIRLSVLWINRLCKPANPAFTMSKEHGRANAG